MRPIWARSLPRQQRPVAADRLPARARVFSPPAFLQTEHRLPEIDHAASGGMAQRTLSRRRGARRARRLQSTLTAPMAATATVLDFDPPTAVVRVKLTLPAAVPWPLKRTDDAGPMS